jgi:GH3 auxin-responsive promoter
MTIKHRLGHGALRRVVAWGERSFRKNLNNLEAVQRRKHQALMAAVATTPFAHKYDLSANTCWEDFSARVPVSGYSDWASDVEALRGTGRAMINSPVTRFQPTSGSTSAIKWIPYTKQFLSELDGAIGPWLADMYRQFPRINRGSHYWSLSWLPTDMRDEGHAELNDDMQLLSAGKRILAASTQAMSENVAMAPTSEGAAFASLVMLAADRHLAVMSVWSPTFALTMLEQLSQWRESVADCLDRGDWGNRQSELGFLNCPRNVIQARLLRDWDGILSADFFSILWPDLALVSAWDTASASRWANVLQQYLPQASFQGKGLWATEGVVTIPYAGQYLLAYQSHVYEFEDLDSGVVMPCWSLHEGQRVAPVISTGSGFMRYRMGDELRVSGFIGQVPTLTFLGREDGVDLVGEKLSTMTALNLLDTLADRFQVNTVSLIALEQSNRAGRPGYIVLLEEAQDYSVDSLEDTAESILLEHFHYRLARSLNQLAPVRVVCGEDMRDFYLQQCRLRGMIEGNIKIEPLRRWDGVVPPRLADIAEPLRATV